MKKIYIIIGISAVTILSAYYLLQRQAPNEGIVRRLLQDFEKTEWRKRDEALGKILYNETDLKKEGNKKDLIKLFEKEQKIRQEREKQFDLKGGVALDDGEAYGEYYIALLDVAGKLRDPATIPFLVDSVEWGLGVWQNLAVFGDQSVEPLIDKFKTAQDELKREGCISALNLLSKQKISENSKIKIRQMFSDALEDRSKHVREAAQEALKETH